MSETVEELNELGHFKMNVMKAIKNNCNECMGDDNPKHCTVKKCALYPYKLGKNPFRVKRVVTEEQRQAFIDNVHGKKGE